VNRYLLVAIQVGSARQTLHALIEIGHLPALAQVNGFLEQVLALTARLFREHEISLLNRQHCSANDFCGIRQWFFGKIMLKLLLAVAREP